MSSRFTFAFDDVGLILLLLIASATMRTALSSWERRADALPIRYVLLLPVFDWLLPLEAAVVCWLALLIAATVVAAPTVEILPFGPSKRASTHGVVSRARRWSRDARRSEERQAPALVQMTAAWEGEQRRCCGLLRVAGRRDMLTRPNAPRGEDGLVLLMSPAVEVSTRRRRLQWLSIGAKGLVGRRRGGAAVMLFLVVSL